MASTTRPAKSSTTSSCFAADPSKAHYEKLSLIWSPLSLLFLLLGVFATPLYKHCDRNSFLLITVLACLPGFLLPILFPCPADRARPFTRRFWVKATVWISIFGFYGNYFWTHYFYTLLGARYLFDSYRFNDVPLVTFTSTFFYFTFYFNLVSLLLRRIARNSAHLPLLIQRLVWCANIAALSYATAVFEAVSIQHFPLYTYTERETFILVGSVVYGLYFVVGFPMFFSLDEDPDKPPMPLRTAAANALAATAIVTLLLDLWRLFLGSIYEAGKADISLPFVYQRERGSSEEEEQEKLLKCSEHLAACTEQAANWVYRKVWSSAKLLEEKSREVTMP